MTKEIKKRSAVTIVGLDTSVWKKFRAMAMTRGFRVVGPAVDEALKMWIANPSAK